MASKSSIEWTESTWNPVTGCTKVSPGCLNCYAERFAERWRGIPGHAYEQGFDLKLHPDRLSIPLSWRKPRRVFVNSMSDLFHEGIPDDFILDVFSVMEQASRHQFQVLTKRPKRMLELSKQMSWPSNVWAGVSVESQAWMWRIEVLREVPAFIRFLSCEPLLGRLEGLSLNDIHWVIVGGESGPGSRLIDAGWVRSIRDQCQEEGVSFFFKQWGGTNKKRTGRILDGQTWDEFPLSPNKSKTLEAK